MKTKPMESSGHGYSEGSEPVKLTENELIDKLFKAEEEIRRLIQENKALGEMYANTFGKLRDLEAKLHDIEKESSDMKANLHRAYNGLENYKKIKSENANLQQQLKEERNKAIDECIAMFKDEFSLSGEDVDSEDWALTKRLESLKSDSK